MTARAETLRRTASVLRDRSFCVRKVASDLSQDFGARYYAAVMSEDMCEEAAAIELLAQIREAPP